MDSCEKNDVGRYILVVQKNGSNVSRNADIRKTFFNPFLAIFHILYLLKRPWNFCFSGVFRGVRLGTLFRNGLIKISVTSKL